MEQTLIQNAQAYASQHRLSLAERLGFGVHGIFVVAEDNVKVRITHGLGDLGDPRLLR